MARPTQPITYSKSYPRLRKWVRGALIGVITLFVSLAGLGVAVLWQAASS